jgi:lysophospholipase L1-like esterase
MTARGLASGLASQLASQLAGSGGGGAVNDFRDGILVDLDASIAESLWQDSARTTPANPTDQVLGWTDNSGNGFHALQTQSRPGLVYRTTSGVKKTSGEVLPTLQSASSPATMLTLGNPSELNDLASGSYSVAILGAIANAILAKSGYGDQRISFWATSGKLGRVGYVGAFAMWPAAAWIYTYEAATSTTGTEKVYLNGKVVETRTGAMPDWNTERDWRISGFSFDEGGSNTFTGTSNVNLIRLYDKALSENECALLGNFMLNRLEMPLIATANRFIATGDSICHGAFDSLGGFVQRAINALKISKPHVKSANTGLPGTQASIIASFMSSYLTLNGGSNVVVLVQAGTNDLAANATAAAVYNSRKSIATAWKNVGAKVIMSSVLPRTAAFSNGQDAAGFESQRQSLLSLELADFDQATGVDRIYENAVANTWADYLIDFGNDPLIGTTASADATTYYSDKVHPNTSGHAIMAEYLTPLLDSLF